MSLSEWPLIVAWVCGMWYVARPLGVQLARLAAARATIGRAERARLTLAFAALGVERVAVGLAATGHSWSDCFLALATGGAPAALGGMRHAFSRRGNLQALAGLIGAPSEVLREVVRVWDRDEAGFRELAREWLAHNRAVPRPLSAFLPTAARARPTVQHAAHAADVGTTEMR